MIKEFELYHGAVLAKLAHASSRPITINTYPSPSNASYVLNDAIGLYVKHSTKRLSPWRFTLSRAHQDEILEMRQRSLEVYVVLVCGFDGVVTLAYEELKQILDRDHGAHEWISVSRKPRGEYAVAGSDGSLDFKVSRQDLINKVFASVAGLGDFSAS